MKRKDHNNKTIKVKKNFQDEHEWRYIPNINQAELPLMLVDENDKKQKN